MPPSAMSGTSVSQSASATSATAVTWGTPTPATMRVVQMDPGPIPTLTASAPASTSARAASAVAMLPPMTCTWGKFCFTHRTRFSTFWEWPWAVSTTTTSTSASTSAATRSSVPAPVPTAAPTRRRPRASLQAHGNSVAFWMSRTVMRPRSWKPPFTTSTFSMRCLCSRPTISSRSAPSRTVTRRSFGVMMALTGWS